MAKFKITADLLSSLTDAGFIDGSGNIQVTFTSRVAGITTFYKLTFSAADDIIETTNARMISAIQTMPTPAVKINGTWIIGNPSTVKMFETAVGDPTIDPAVSGVAQITGAEKNLVVRYGNMSGDGPIPTGRDKTTLQPWVVKASTYFANRNL